MSLDFDHCKSSKLLLREDKLDTKISTFTFNIFLVKFIFISKIEFNFFLEIKFSFIDISVYAIEVYREVNNVTTNMLKKKTHNKCNGHSE